ncbi:alpha/beta hydrolase [Phanerochaete sordida]|uniref:Alpha/beta hydrolase n=1 Tax=Phanerochaete sordida TaxID=48140 RepID=A0A9P3LEV0_9APHY|nr:alpha/beta hydrolase [Phanerochaete sordida]
MRLARTNLYLLGLAATATAAEFNPTNNTAGYDTSRVGPSNANCQRQTYQLDITSNNVQFQNVDSNANQTYLTALFQTFTTSMTNFTQMYEKPDKQAVHNTYSLSGTLCVPKKGAKDPSNVQYLLHGVGFDSSYWDFVPDNSTEDYSYVHAAADAGYVTFRYDRLGTGLSEHPQDAYNVVQSPTDLAIATKFAQMLRNGDIGNMKFNKIVGIGHSYGSVQTQALSAASPDLLNAVLLQGFSMNSTGQGVFLPGGDYQPAVAVAPNRFANKGIANAYVVNQSPYTNQLDFFYFPYFSDAALQRSYDTEQPATQGVLFTQAAIMQNATGFRGPVHVVTGAQDLPFCNRDCYAVPRGSPFPNIPAYVKMLYPNARNFSVYIPANTGHGVNAHYSAPETYQEMLQFVDYAFSL